MPNLCIKLCVNRSPCCQTRILPGRAWKKRPEAVKIYCKWGSPILALRWPTMKARILCRNLSFLRKLGTEESTLSASILHSLATEDILNASFVRQCLKLKTYLGTNFTMPICEAILKLPEAESIPDPTRELLKKDFNYILTRAHTHPSLK